MSTEQLVSIVIPVYRGAKTLPALLAEIARFTTASATPGGSAFRIAEVLLVHDGAVDDSDVVIAKLASENAFVSPIWLSRNYGQHPATLAGMASTTSPWVVTMDEDGQHDPSQIGKLLDRALETRAQLVYGEGENAAPHGILRNAASGFAKWVATALLGLGSLGRFSSFRLVDGEVARSLAAFSGNNTYLDVALSWVVGRTERCAIRLRDEGERTSGYTFGKLVQHFGRLVITSGTRPLRLVAWMGLLAMLLSFGLGSFAMWEKLTNRVPVQGWTSLIVVVSFLSGCTLLALGIIAEYLSVTMAMALGRPPYLVVSRAPRSAAKSP